MIRGPHRALKVAVGLLVVALLVWVLTTFRNPATYDVDAATLSGWTLVIGDPGDPALVALQPPPQLSGELFRQVAQRMGNSLVAPERPTVPLVLKSEYADSLQGVLSIEDIMNVAREAGIEAARFAPVCIGQRREPASGRSDRLYFAVFAAAVFDQFRQQLSPLFPEHGGNGFYDAGALRPILAIAASEPDFVSWWPIGGDPRADCLASLRMK